MSFLNTNNSEFISARITQKGRNAIAKGSFNIEYFQIGDSEFDYNLLLTGLTGQTNHEKVLSPFDKESGIKYPYKLNVDSTTYGVAVQQSTTDSIRNVMGPAGFVSNYIPYDSIDIIGTSIKTHTEVISFSEITGGTTLPVLSGGTYQDSEYITLVFSEFGGTDPNVPIIKDNSIGLVYKIVSISGDTLILDRDLPILTTLTGNAQILANNGEIEYPLQTTSEACLPKPLDPSSQQNPWTLNVVWSEKPIGVNVDGNDATFSGYTSSGFNSTKELLGYNTNSQTYSDIFGNEITKPTSYVNSFNEIINVEPEHQRAIAIIHFSELGDISHNPERFFKYDDYISYNDNVGDSIYTNSNDIAITDTEYFEIYIPFINYHRNTSTTTLGALFTMDDTNYYLKSTINEKHQLLYRYLLDEQDNRVGKVFLNNKIVVFDDQELVAILDYKSNRRYTLPAPKISTVPSDEIAVNSLFTGTTGQTMWITYALEHSDGFDFLNSLPCNYFQKIDSSETPSNVTIKFDNNTFAKMGSSFNDLTTTHAAVNFYILAQETDNGELPTSDSWRIIDFTTEVGGNGISYINPSNLENKSFIITRDAYENNSTLFDLEYFMGSGYTSTLTQQFGDEQPFPGSIRLVRGTDIEQMNFLVNLPSTQFLETQNPTYVSGDKRVTEIALLDSNKEPLVVAKTPYPVKRVGTQIFSIRLDF